MPMPKMPPGLNDKKPWRKPTRPQIKAALDATKPYPGLRGGTAKQRPFLAVDDVRVNQAVALVTDDNLAAAIMRISASLKTLEKTRLNRTAIIVLLHDHTKIAKRTILEVLNGLADLEKKYTTPKG